MLERHRYWRISSPTGTSTLNRSQTELLRRHGRSSQFILQVLHAIWMQSGVWPGNTNYLLSKTPPMQRAPTTVVTTWGLIAFPVTRQHSAFTRRRTSLQAKGG